MSKQKEKRVAGNTECPYGESDKNLRISEGQEERHYHCRIGRGATGQVQQKLEKAEMSWIMSEEDLKAYTNLGLLASPFGLEFILRVNYNPPPPPLPTNLHPNLKYSFTLELVKTRHLNISVAL